MNLRNLLIALTPPVAVCRWGCASCCAAPIAVFWIAGITGIVYGFLGGPAQLPHVSWTTVGLGAGLWVIAAVWAWTTLRSVEEDLSDPACREGRSTICRLVPPRPDEADPLDEVRKFQQ